MNNIVFTNAKIFKIKMIDWPQCTFCKKEIESLEHLFYNCKITRSFWVALRSWLMECNINLEPLSTFNVLCGIFNAGEDFVIGNRLILMAKFYIYRCKLNGVKPGMRVLNTYIKALTSNIKDRLGNSPKVIEAYAIFDPLLLPSSDDDSFKEYGDAEVRIIADHFFPGNEDQKRKLLCQWSQVKYFLSGKKFQVPAESHSSTFFMSFMLKNHGIFHPSIFEEILFVAEVGLSLPCSNAWPERGGSVINITKTKFRNRLNNDMLNSLMQVSINAPGSNQCSDIVKSAVDNWLKQKPRKKLKKATVRPQSENNLEGVEKETQEKGESDAAEEEEACIATPVEASAEEEAAAVVSTIGLPDPEYDSAIESDCESDHDFW